MQDNRWEHLDEDFEEEKSFVKIRTHPKYKEDGYMEKPSKIKKKGRRVAQRFKEFQSPQGDSDGER